MLKSFTLQDFSITSTASPSPCHLFVHGKLFCESPLSFMLPGFVNLFVHVANSFVNHPFSSCCQVLRIVHCKLFWESPLYVSPGLWITSSFTSQNFLNQPFSFVLPGPLRSCFVNHPFSCRKVRKPFYESPLFFMLPGFENDLFVHSELFCEWPLLSFLSIISSFMLRF